MLARAALARRAILRRCSASRVALAASTIDWCKPAQPPARALEKLADAVRLVALKGACAAPLVTLAPMAFASSGGGAEGIGEAMTGLAMVGAAAVATRLRLHGGEARGGGEGTRGDEAAGARGGGGGGFGRRFRHTQVQQHEGGGEDGGRRRRRRRERRAERGRADRRTAAAAGENRASSKCARLAFDDVKTKR